VAKGSIEDERLPLTPPSERPKASPAPAWVALFAAWTGLMAFVTAVVAPLLPGSRDPRAELEGLRNYSLADRFLPVPLYISVVALFLGIVVLWQSRHEPRPLSDALGAQRMQAGVGIALALAGAAIIYAFVALRGPG
jgi:hypothetical protein